MIWSILYIGYIGLLRPPFTRALTLPPDQDLSIITPSASPVNESLPPSLTIGSAAPPMNTRYGPLRDPVCDGDLLGFDMNRYSCFQAWATIPTGRDPLTFGDRKRGFDVELPRRFSGPDGTCVIDVFHKNGVVVDTASYLLISRAAEKVYGTCVAIGGQRTQGGYLRDLGRNKGLAVALSIYHPSVSCHGRQLYITNQGPLTQELLSMIPVDKEHQRFGPEGEPGVNVVLPVTYSSPENPPHPWSPRLKSTVDVEHRHTVTARWLDVWAGAVAVTAMCTVKGYSGTSGLTNGLSVTVGAVREGQGMMGNETAVS